MHLSARKAIRDAWRRNDAVVRYAETIHHGRALVGVHWPFRHEGVAEHDTGNGRVLQLQRFF